MLTQMPGACLLRTHTHTQRQTDRQTDRHIQSNCKLT